MPAWLRGVCGAAVLAGALVASPPLWSSPAQAEHDVAQRGELTLGEIQKSKVSGLVENRWFVPGGDAKPAHEDFTGTLLVSENLMNTEPAKFTSRNIQGKDPKIFPALRLSFFTYKGDLVPVSQDVIRAGAIPGGRSYWDIIVQPGKVWSEAADKGWSRASFPFALVNSREGETHNGIATFLYKGGRISKLQYQIVQQTSPYNVVDYFTAWGTIPAGVTKTVEASGAADRGLPVNLGKLKATYQKDLDERLRIKSWDDLGNRVGAAKLKDFDSAMPPSDLLVSGLYVDGTLYLKECNSAAGPLPYCDRQRFGVWSIGNSLTNLVALLRLGQKYGPEIYREKIVDYVRPGYNADDWADVTFADALNMATGIGRGSTKRDPNNIADGYIDEAYGRWYDARGVQQKLDWLFKDGKKYPWKPGEVARLRDEDMFLLGVAIDRLVKRKEGAQADIWSLLMKEVYGPIGIQYAPTDRTIEAKGEGAYTAKGGQPLTAFGYYPTLGDMVKIAQLLQYRGWHAGQLLLDDEKLGELQVAKVGADNKLRGLPTGNFNKYGEVTYAWSLWQAPFDSPEGCTLRIPQMDGWGGNYVVMMPGRITAIRLGKSWKPDANVADTTGMMQVANRLTSFCH
ncbi:MAG: hypothetical protein E6Q98_11810 [Rhodospirillaceae bacterium]|nr:MAG: hypothetical protein E6Q98_11810 [Rhodospirillaceae bacterium]